MKELHEYVKYDITSPTGLRWAKVIYSGRYLNIPMTVIGSVAGNKTKGGYYRLCLMRRNHLCHRLIYDMEVEAVGAREVDHIDGDTTNNAVSNLRAVDHRTNSENRGKQSNNTSGTTGVHFTKSGRNTYCSATTRDVQDREKKVVKHFSISRFGLLPAYRMAVLHRLLSITELNLAGASYTERHGV